MSLLGNSVIIHIIRSDNAMRTTTNFLILNQACDDLLITITQSVNVFHHIYLDAVNVTDVSLNFFLPLLLITALYAAVCITLWSREVPGEGANQNAQQAEAMKTARKVTQMMIVV
ncbi:unnamed protein product, partial [Porites evermanni]